MLDAQVGHLLYASPGIVEREEERAITQRTSSARRQVYEERRDLVALEIARLRWGTPLGRNARHALGDIEHLRHAAGHVAEESMDSRQSLISRVDPITTLDLEMSQEAQNTVEGEISERQSGQRAVGVLRNEREYKPQRIAVAADRCGAKTFWVAR